MRSLGENLHCSANNTNGERILPVVGIQHGLLQFVSLNVTALRGGNFHCITALRSRNFTLPRRTRQA